jgi:hypothetical protein
VQRNTSPSILHNNIHACQLGCGSGLDPDSIG